MLLFLGFSNGTGVGCALREAHAGGECLRGLKLAVDIGTLFVIVLCMYRVTDTIQARKIAVCHSLLMAAL